MQAAFNKYGADAFVFEILLFCEKDAGILAMYEQALLDQQIASTSRDSVYNYHVLCVTSCIGTVRSEETRERMRAVQKDRPYDPASIERMRLVNVGRKLSPESIAKRTAKQTGLKRTDETKKKMSIAALGKVRSPETRARISASKKGVRPAPGHMEKMRIANLGSKRTPEAIEACSAAKRGKKKPPEEIARRQATRRANALKNGTLFSDSGVEQQRARVSI